MIFDGPLHFVACMLRGFICSLYTPRIPPAPHIVCPKCYAVFAVDRADAQRWWS